MKYDSAKFRKALKTKRIIEKEVSLRDVSDEVGLSIATISRIERGKTPEIDTLLKLLKWLDKPLSDYIY